MNQTELEAALDELWKQQEALDIQVETLRMELDAQRTTLRKKLLAIPINVPDPQGINLYALNALYTEYKGDKVARKEVKRRIDSYQYFLSTTPEQREQNTLDFLRKLKALSEEDE